MAITLIVIVLSLLAVMLLALHSERVTAFVLPKVLAGLPIDIVVDETGGTLADGLTLNGVHVRHEQADIDIGTLSVKVALQPLLRRTLVVEYLTTDQTLVTMIAPASPPEPKPFAAPVFSSPVNVTVDQLKVTNTTIRTTADIVVSSINSTLALRESTLTLTSLDVVTPDVTAKVNGEVRFDGDVPLDLTVSWRVPAQDLNGAGTLTGDLRAVLLSHDLAGAYTVTTEGSVALVERVVPAAQMTHRCTKDCAPNDITLNDVVLTHEGAIDDSSFTLSANVATAQLPLTAVAANGRVTGEALTIESARLKGVGLATELRGTLAFGDTPVFDMSANVARLDAAMLNPAVAGSVKGTATIQGSGAEAFTAKLKNVEGVINGFRLSASANVVRQGATWNLRPVDLRLGDNVVKASGRVTQDKLDLVVKATLNELTQIVPQWQGALTADATIGGRLSAPQAKVDLSGRDLEVATLSVGSVNGDLTIDAQGVVGGTLSADKIDVGERDLGTVSLDIGGTLKTFETRMDWQLPGNTLALTVVTEPVDGGATATVAEAALESDTIGTWSLDQPFTVDARDGDTRIGAHVWRSDDAFMQINDARVGAQDITLDALLSNMPLQTFDVFTPPGVRLVGLVDATVSVKKELGIWSGDVDWAQRGTIVQLRDGNASRRLALETVELRGNVVGTDGNVTLTLTGDYDLDVKGDLALSELTAANGPALNGTVRASVPDLAWLGPWIGGVSDLAGSASLDLSVAGSGATPSLTGQFMLSDSAISLDDAGIRLENLQLRGAGQDAQALTLTGSASSGGGNLSFDGEITQPWSTQRTVSVTVKGQDVQAFNARDYQVWVSPDLQLDADAKGARVAGRIDVPRANIRVEEVPANVVQPSRDVKVTGREPAEAFDLPLRGEVTLALGDDVHIFALGLDTDLRGDLKLAVQQGKQPLFNGRLYLENGKFQAYGQKLGVDRGNLFYGGAIDNPTLDFRATREIANSDQPIVAGVRVTGPAQDPRIEVFSEPATSSTDALSYLLLGRASADASGADSAALSQTALSIGMSRSSPLTTQLAANLGLDELSVGGDSLDAAELVAGKQVNERLYIRYSYGVFSNIGAILLRYRLSRRLALEAGSADSQSLDVLYTIEK